MKLRISRNGYTTFALASIPFFMLFSREATFNIQSIIIPIILLMSGHILFGNSGKKSKDCLLILTLYVVSMFISFFENFFFYENKITNLYLIRIVYTFVVLFFYFWGTETMLCVEEIKSIFICNIAVGIFISFYYMFVNSIWYTNFLGVVMDKNFCGGYLAVVSEIAFYLFYYEKRKRARILYLAIFAILFAGTFYSGSRAAVLVSLGGVLMIAGENILLDLKKRKILLRALALLVFLFVFLIIAFPEMRRYFLTNEKLQWYWNRYFVLKNYVDYSNNSRLSFWRNGIELWKKRIIFGYGPGLVSVTFNSSAVAHNTFIDYMVDMGLVGLAGFLLILRRSWKGIFRHGRQSFRALPVSIFLLSIILSMTRSVLFWYMLIISWLMSCTIDTDNRGLMQ